MIADYGLLKGGLGIRLGRTHLNWENAECEKIRAIPNHSEKDSHDRHIPCRYSRAFWNEGGLVVRLAIY